MKCPECKGTLEDNHNISDYSHYNFYCRECDVYLWRGVSE